VLKKYNKGSQPPVERFSLGFQHLVEKLSGQNQTAFFFDSYVYVASMLYFVKLGLKSEAKVAFLNLVPIPKELRNQKLKFSIAAHLPFY